MRFALLFLFCCIPTWAGTFTAATCNQSDVNAVINGPTHTVVNGDTIIIPTGSCTWSSGVTGPSGVAFTIIGGGASANPNATPSTNKPNSTCTATVITDSFSGALFNLSPSEPGVASNLTRISCIEFAPGSGAGGNIVLVNGTCISGPTCPNYRQDNLTINIGFPQSDTLTQINNVFGVVDHNDNESNGSMAQINHGSWAGVGNYGDNSWGSADNFGTSQQVYVENNYLGQGGANATLTDATVFPPGGARFTCRFNGGFASTTGYCYGHGTETGSRARGVRQVESYGNSAVCAPTSCDTTAAARSGVWYAWGNTWTASVAPQCTQPTPPCSVNSFVKLFLERGYRPQQWGLSAGVGAFDQNSGAAVAHTDTASSFASPTLNLTTGGLTPGAYNFSPSAPGANYYTVIDTANSSTAGIASNTANSLTLSWKNAGFNGSFAIANGDPIKILSTTLYAAGTATGGTVASLTDATKSFPNYAGYSVFDVTQYQSCLIASNTATTLTCATYDGIHGIYCPSPCPSFNSGDTYAIMKVTQALDQPGVSGDNFSEQTYPVPLLPAQTLDPIYEWDEGGTTPGAIVASQSPLLVSYSESSASQTAQTSATSPFNGTSGTGWGPCGAACGGSGSAFRPTTCTTGVGYWATDVGTWNSSGLTYQGGFSQGELYKCTATNTWTLSYIPYTYPHPLISGGGGGGSFSCSPTTILFGAVNQNSGTLGEATTCTNTTSGTVTLTGGNITSTGGFASQFSIGTVSCGSISSATIAPGANCTIFVNFTPTFGIGTVATGQFNLDFSGASGSPIAIALNGTIVNGIPGPSLPSFAELIP